MESGDAMTAGNGGAIERLWRRLRPVLARVVHTARRQADRALHPGRRRRARSRLIRQGSPGEVLVLCYGNICRSPYAAVYLEQALRRQGAATVVSQGGFFGPDRPANDTARQVSRERGIDLERHRSRLVTAEDASRAGLVVVMEEEQARRMTREYRVAPDRLLILGDLDPEPVNSRRIPDPYGHPPPVFAATYDRIDRCLNALLEVVPLARLPR